MTQPQTTCDEDIAWAKMIIESVCDQKVIVADCNGPAIKIALAARDKIIAPNKDIFEWLATAILRGDTLDEKAGREYGDRFWNGCLERLELLRGRLNV